MSMDKETKISAILFFTIVISLIVIVSVGLNADRKIVWPVTISFMLIMFMAIGWSIKGRLLGVLINERKSMSLSRFQIALWTLIVLSAYVSIAFFRARDCGVTALDVAVPAEVWMLMGISSAALVGSPLLASNKTKKVPADTNLKEREEMGILSVKDNDSKASFTDLFKGVEVKNWDYVDMPRLQMFFFTSIVAIAYCVEVYKIVSTGDLSNDISLPTIDQGMVTLMGISNAAYLGGKSIDQTPAKAK